MCLVGLLQLQLVYNTEVYSEWRIVALTLICVQNLSFHLIVADEWSKEISVIVPTWGLCETIQLLGC